VGVVKVAVVRPSYANKIAGAAWVAVLSPLQEKTAQASDVLAPLKPEAGRAPEQTDVTTLAGGGNVVPGTVCSNRKNDAAMATPHTATMTATATTERSVNFPIRLGGMVILSPEVGLFLKPNDSRRPMGSITVPAVTGPLTPRPGVISGGRG